MCPHPIWTLQRLTKQIEQVYQYLKSYGVHFLIPLMETKLVAVEGLG